jgi:hypothetical protein
MAAIRRDTVARATCTVPPMGEPRRALITESRVKTAATSLSSCSRRATKCTGVVGRSSTETFQDEPDDFVVATGENHSVRELVDLAFDHVGLEPDQHVEMKQAG